MSLHQVLLILWRRGWITVLTMVTALVVAGAVLLVAPSRYDAVATASLDPSDPVEMTGNAGNTAIGLMQGNMLQLITSQRVALDVVKRLNLTASPQVQAAFRASDSFGRESIENWEASSIVKSVDPKFEMGTDILTIKYKTGNPSQAALLANAFLAAAIDETVAMKVASAEQTAQWFAPQTDELRKEFQDARSRLEAFQSQSNIAVPNGGSDAESTNLVALNRQLSDLKATLTALKSRLDSGDTNISTDPSDPDLQMLNGLKERLATAQTEIGAAKTSLGANNPKMLAVTANIESLRKAIADATLKQREHLKARIALTEGQIASTRAAQDTAGKSLIEAQAQQDRLAEMQHDASFKLQELNQRERTAEEAKLRSKLTFANVAVLDKAVPPIAPSFPKPLIVIPVAIGAGLALGLVLAMLAEMLDRRIRVPFDLELATSMPVLGVIQRTRIQRTRISRNRGRLIAAQ
jgi:polysaccharide biosynthesis transport protein